MPSGDCVGWVRGEDLYLDPESAYAATQQLGEAQGERLAVSQRQLHKRLDEQGFLVSKEKGKPVGRDHINGIEGFWSYAKNWLYPFRGVPRKHFHLYLGEICFRFNHRDEDLYPLLYKLLRTTDLQ